MTSNLEFYALSIAQNHLFWSVAFFCLGTIFASFLNVCIYRLPLGMSLISPPSSCPNCDHRITPLENVPILSYLFLGGKCSSCRKKISPRYIIVETIGGMLFLLIYLSAVRWNVFELRMVPLMMYVSLVLVGAAFTDCDTRIIPDEMTYPAMIICPLYYLAGTFSFGQGSFDKFSFIASAASMATAWGLLTLFAAFGRKIFGREAFGRGDVKLMSAVAACFFIDGAAYVLLGASVLALVCAVPYRKLKHLKKSRAIPFAPFISTAALAWMFFGRSIFSCLRQF